MSKLIPDEAHSIEVFAIKETEYGKEAFIGYKLENGNFHFVGVPYTEEDDKLKQIECYKKLLEMSGVPQVLIDNPTLIFGKPSKEAINWAKEILKNKNE